MNLSKIILFFPIFIFQLLKAQELTDLKADFFSTTEISIPVPSPSIADNSLKPKNPKNTLPLSLPDNPLIVVHASSNFDENKTAKKGMDLIISNFKKAGKPLIYLINDQSQKGYSDWYTADRSPDYELFSAGGEHNLPLQKNEVTIVGGFFGSYDGSRGCHALAARDAIRMHFELSNETFTVNMPIKGIYFYEEDYPTKERLMKIKPGVTPEKEIKKAFKNFAEMFFLVDNFPTSTPDSLGFAHPFTFHDQHPSYREGEPVDTARYSFELYFDNILVSSFGSGPRKVLIKMNNW